MSDLTVRQELDLLKSEIAAMKRAYATEVRTRRLVVEDENGFERIYTTIDGSGVELAVEWDRHDAKRELRAVMGVQHGGVDDGPFYACVYASAAGTLVAELDATIELTAKGEPFGVGSLTAIDDGNNGGSVSVHPDGVMLDASGVGEFCAVMTPVPATRKIRSA